MSKRAARWGIVQRNILLSFAYAVFWAVVHYAATGQSVHPGLLTVQLAVSALMFFALNGLFATFGHYRRGWIFQVLVSILYIQPFFQLFYYRTYKSFLDQQNISLIIREPYFLIKVFAAEMTWDKGLILAAGIALFYFVNRKGLGKVQRTPPHRPYDLFLNRWALLFTFVMIGLQIKWCLDHDPSQLAMRPFYPVTLMALASIFTHLVRSRAPAWERVSVGALIVIGITHLYALNLAFLDERGKLTLDHQFYRALFGAFYVQTAFGDMSQDDHARARFHALPEAEMDYNILISINDAQRWDAQSSNGYPRPTDDELEWFIRKSFNFRFPVSPANFTDTAVPALVSGLASDQDVKKIKGSLSVWDYFAKGAETFFISSQDITWSKLNLFYASVGQKHVWSWTAQPGYKGNPEDTNDLFSMEHVRDHVNGLKKPWVGAWQTFASHYPYTVNPGFDRYKPCVLDRSAGTEAFRNCYLNAQVYSAHLRSELFKSIDLEKTVVVLTSDHGEGIGEHGIFFHGVDYHQEMVKVPFVLHIPGWMQKKIPAAAMENLRRNLNRVISTTDMTPTLLHLHEMVTGQKLYEDLSWYSGRSLFTSWDHRVVFSSHCFPQYRCYSREIMFADDDYYVIFRPSEGFYKIYATWTDLDQTRPLDFKDVDHAKFERLVEEAARIHPAGQQMKAYYERFKQSGFRSF